MKARFEQRGDVGELVLADPPLNLFDTDLIADLTLAGRQAAQADVRAVLVHAEGEHFSAGANVEIFRGLSTEQAEHFADEVMRDMAVLEQLPVPTVALVHGMCLGAGVEIALACDLLWTTDETQLGLVEATIGGIPFTGGAQRLAERAGSARAKEAVYGGRVYPSQTWFEWGVVNRLVPADELLDKGRRYSRQLAAGPTRAHAATKQLIATAVREDRAAADAQLPELAGVVIASDDLQHGVTSLLTSGPGLATFTGR